MSSSVSLSRFKGTLVINIESTGQCFDHSQGKSHYEKWNDRELSSRDHDLFNSTQVGETRECTCNACSKHVLPKSENERREENLAERLYFQRAKVNVP